MAAGVALTMINSAAVLEALFGYQTSFARTPKYAIGGTQKVKLENIQYRRRSGWLPYAELARGHVFLAMTVFAIESCNYLAVPFLLLFVGGYYLGGVQHPVGRISGQAGVAAAAGAGSRQPTGQGCLALVSSRWVFFGSFAKINS